LGVVDYSDLVTLSHRIVSGYPELARAIRDRYRVVVLDEYQDTNPAQRVLLRSIFDDGFPVIAVGDEDQTIYEWRGASAENFELFGDHFRTKAGGPAEELGLTLNRRSAQPILDVANVVRRRANENSEILHSVYPEAPGEVITHWAGDALKEAEWIARSFEALHEDGLAWSSMAVLFRKNRDFAVVVDALSKHDIPLEVANIGGLLSVPEVAEIRSWLTVLERPEDSATLTQILFGSRFRLGLADLAPLTRWVVDSLDDVEVEDPEPITLIEAIENSSRISDLSEHARKALLRFVTIYREVLTESQGMTLVETCRLILDRTRAWQDMDALPPNPRLTARLNIYRLLDLAEAWSPLEGRPSLGAFLDYLDAMEDEPADELDSARLSGEEAVTLVTVHRAKGLEWDTVAIPAVTATNFPSRAQQYPDPVRFAEYLPVDMRIDSSMNLVPADQKERTEFLRARHYDQEWRVAYVALTRAKSRVLLSGAYWYGLPEPTKNPKKPSELFELVAEQPATVSDNFAMEGPRPDLLRSEPAPLDPDPLFEDGWAAALRKTIEVPSWADALAVDLGIQDDYKPFVERARDRLFNLALPITTDEEEQDRTISVTSMVTMAQCPKRFFWSNIDPLPRRPNRAATRGTEVHRRIELHQRGQIPFDEVSVDFYDVPEGDGGPGAYETYLGSPYSERRAELVETPFTFELDNGFKVRGRIDAVYRHDGHWEIVDFKSGRNRADPSRVVQLQAYAVAAFDVDFGLERPDTVQVSFVYLGGGLEVVTYGADERWVAEARASLNHLSEAVLDEAFGENPGEWCRTCDFLRFCEPGKLEVGDRSS
ncbi:MAG: ATP-dependent DNA helicase, partial [Acidimicrobiia bacterium]